MTCRNHRNQLFKWINSFIHAFLINIRKMFYELFFIHFSTIEAYIFITRNFHFVVNGSCYNITRSQFFSFVIFMHEFFAIFQTKFCAITTNCFGNQKQHSVMFRIHCSRVKLDVLHVRDFTASSVNKSNSVSSCNFWVGSIFVNMTSSTSCYHGYFCGNFLDFFIFLV